jgi:hypothetical protein
MANTIKVHRPGLEGPSEPILPDNMCENLVPKSINWRAISKRSISTVSSIGSGTPLAVNGVSPGCCRRAYMRGCKSLSLRLSCLGLLFGLWM